jgi:hypothetical protein
VRQSNKITSLVSHFLTLIAGRAASPNSPRVRYHAAAPSSTFTMTTMPAYLPHQNTRVLSTLTEKTVSFLLLSSPTSYAVSLSRLGRDLNPSVTIITMPAVFSHNMKASASVSRGSVVWSTRLKDHLRVCHHSKPYEMARYHLAQAQLL